ncbi:choice-of-anchor A family protein [Microbacterium sp. NPDC058062]|uniref:choice-of-anchor A family protein n=1 Tax=Microbacterium sp. NPDC058062 TaxID=3346320 RepID=UPI0036DC9388
MVRRIGAVLAIGALAGAGVIAVSPLAQPEAAVAAVGECPPGTIPGPGNDNPVFTDNNVAVYAGGDFSALPSSAEVEGLVVVAGSADFAGNNGTVNVGWVGVGSGVAPTPGEVMLAVGGDLSVGAGTVLDVGANAVVSGELLGGSVQVGGATTPDYETDGSRYRLNNGTLTQDMGADAIADWATWGTDITAASTSYAALAPTGTTTAAFTRIDFAGDGAATQQVFTIASSALAANPEIHFSGIPDGATVIVNVTGSGPVTWAPYYFGDGADRVDDPASPMFGVVSQRTLWNFTAATSVHVAGSSQVLGTILVPAADPAADQPVLRVTASTNGRLYTNGSIVMDGVGNEHHNYPFVDAPFACIPDVNPPILQTGSVTITKNVSPEDAALLPEDTLFLGTVTCDIPEDGVAVAEWAVAPGETTLVDGLPAGAQCVVAEHLGVGARVFAPPVSGTRADPAAHFAWETPVWDPAPPTFTVVPGVEPQIDFTLTNTIARGAFTIEKAVTGDGAPDVEFSGAWQCTLGATLAGSGTWSLSAGETSDPIAAPVGATCTVSETTPGDPGDGLWEIPVIDPDSIVVTAGSAEVPLQVVVTNVFVPAAALGAFTITKAVENPDDVVFSDGFRGTWMCTTPDGLREVLVGTWSLAAGETTDAIEAPVGAVCSVAEVQPQDPEGASWGEPELSPASLVITDASAQQPLAFTVTNTLTAGQPGVTPTPTPTPTPEPDPGPGPDGELPATGTTVPWWAIAVGGALLIGGAAVVLITVVRRRRS